MDTTKLRQIHADRANRDLEQTRHESSLRVQADVAQTIIVATSTLLKFLKGHTTKAEVVNQLKEIATPDVLQLLPELKEIANTLKAQKEVELKELTGVMKAVLDEAKAIPKSLPEQAKVEIPDYAQQFQTLTKAVADLTTAVKAQKLVAEAPVVNVDAPEVKVDAPDLTPLESGLSQVKQAVKDAAPPEVQKTQDLSGLITEEYDEFKANYSDPDFSDMPVVESVNYLFHGKTVATLKFSYTKAGDVKSVKKVTPK